MAARFQVDWLVHPEYKDWIQEVPSEIHKAKCALCNSSFSLSNMGKRALTSHAKGGQHQKRMAAANQTVSIKFFTSQKNEPPKGSITPSIIVDPSRNSTNCDKSVNLNPENLPVPSPAASSSLKSFLVNDNVTRAEILWCLNTVLTHKSMRMSEKDITVMKAMILDSEIVKKMQLKRSKIAYSILYGIAPFFKNELLAQLSKCKYFTLGFDESLNKVSQKIQMDINVRFWCTDKKEVCTRYLTSAFLGRTTADDLRHNFKDALSPINLSSVIQISMDGPNVNHKFLKDLKAEMSLDEDNPVFLDIGSCGLHILHGSFKTSINATKWNLISFLRAIYNLFKNVPARRALYTEYSGSTVFPKKFCSVRWLQNADVAQRAIEIIPHLKKFVDGMKKNKKDCDCASFKTVSLFVEDPLLESKLAFFKSLSGEVEPFLREYQSDAPLVPFLHGSLQSIVTNVMTRFIKEDVIKGNTSIHKVDLMESKNMLHSNDVDLGYGTRSALKKRNKGKVSDQNISQFRKECASSLKAFTLKLLERSPLKYMLTKSVTCFDPSIAINSHMRKNRLKKLLTILEENKFITDLTAEKADREFENICCHPYVLEELKKYSRYDCRIDVFWRDIFKRFETSKSIFDVMKIIMCMSHGNANVERGFSVNKECLVENLKEETLVGQRLVYDYIVSSGGNVEDFDVPKGLIHSFRNSRSLLTEDNKKRQRELADKETEESRKKRVKLATKQLENKVAEIKENTNKEVKALMEQIKLLNG